MCLLEIHPARLIYPSDGPVSGYYHRHPDPVVPVYWLAEEIAPSVEQAIAMYDPDTPPRPREACRRRRSDATRIHRAPPKAPADSEPAILRSAERPMRLDGPPDLAHMVANLTRVADLRPEDSPRCSARSNTCERRYGRAWCASRRRLLSMDPAANRSSRSPRSRQSLDSHAGTSTMRSAADSSQPSARGNTSGFAAARSRRGSTDVRDRA